MSITFPLQGMSPYVGTLPGITVKGIGPGSLAATAMLDFSTFKTVQGSNGANYNACLLDFFRSGAVSPIDSLRALYVDNTEGVASSAPVYFQCQDTQQTVVCPPNSTAWLRLVTNNLQIGAYQETVNAGQVRVVAVNYDIPGEIAINEGLNTLVGELPFTLATPIDLTSTGTITLLAADPGHIYTITELSIDSYGMLTTFNPAQIGSTSILLAAGARVLEKRVIMAPTDLTCIPNKTLVQRSGFSWRYNANDALVFMNSTIMKGWLNLSLSYNKGLDVI